MLSRKTLYQIRSKYEGTAEEHDLLRALCEDERKEWERADEYKEMALKQLEEREKWVKERDETLRALEDGNHIDRAIYHWKRVGAPDTPEANESWSYLGAIIQSFRGRGVTADMLDVLAKRMREFEAAEQAELNEKEASDEA